MGVTVGAFTLARPGGTFYEHDPPCSAAELGELCRRPGPYPPTEVLAPGLSGTRIAADRAPIVAQFRLRCVTAPKPTPVSPLIPGPTRYQNHRAGAH
jgi:hypothetical protein